MIVYEVGGLVEVEDGTPDPRSTTTNHPSPPPPPSVAATTTAQEEAEGRGKGVGGSEVEGWSGGWGEEVGGVVEVEGVWGMVVGGVAVGGSGGVLGVGMSIWGSCKTVEIDLLFGIPEKSLHHHNHNKDPRERIGR